MTYADAVEEVDVGYSKGLTRSTPSHMTARTQWIRVMLLAAVCYSVAGIVTALLARYAPSTQLRTACRLAAWIVGLAIFLAQIAWERLRLRSAVLPAALHAAIAVALGAVALAAVGPVRSHWGEADFWRVSALSLPLWPIVLGVPAFVAALVVGRILRPHPLPADG